MYFLRRGRGKFVDDVICVLWLNVVERKVVNLRWEAGIIHPVAGFGASLHAY